MAVGVDDLSGAKRFADGVAGGVVHCQIYNEVAVAVGEGVDKILRINARGMVWRIIDAAYGDAAHVAVGVDNLSGAKRFADGVADGVVDNQVYNKILIAAIDRVAQILSINAGGIIRRVVVAADRHTAEMSVGINKLSGTDGAVYSVAKGVANGQIDIQHAVASTNGKQRLIVHAGTCHGVAVLDKGITRTYFGCNVAIQCVSQQMVVVVHAEFAAGIVNKRHVAIIIVVGVENYAYCPVSGHGVQGVG